ncbi:MAG: DNA adenine methylase [Porphyromonadaceae bacterium]|nr:DNA adenine methylase [Porphyromonadaceae bacterium]
MAVRKNRLATPFLKWVGGKRQILSSIAELLPKDINKLHYAEPFIGGGAVLFHLQPKNAIINDSNEELINVYKVIKNNHLELINDLKSHVNSSEYFYKIRSLDRSKDYSKLTDVKRASRILYLNKTCFNGLYRVNNAGEFNAPFGYYKNPNIVNEPTLKAVNKFLNNNNIVIKSGDYEELLGLFNKKTFVYMDPPYHPISNNSNFTGYVQGGWDIYDQIRLRDFCDKLDGLGIKFLLSNSSAPFIKQIYENYKITTVKAKRAINSIGSERGQIDEVLIRNYE